MNLSVLTSDFWAAGARILLFGGFSARAAVSFAASAAMVCGGIAIYVTAPSQYDCASAECSSHGKYEPVLGSADRVELGLRDAPAQPPAADDPAASSPVILTGS